MSSKLDNIFKIATKRYNTLKREYEKEVKKCENENYKKFGEDMSFWAKTTATSDEHTEPQKITTKDGLCFWVFNSWLSSNAHHDVERIDGRFAVKSCALWYEPFAYHNGVNHKVFFEQSEKEKILFENYDFKISLVRHNVIPLNYRFSYVWKPQMTNAEFTLYYKDHDFQNHQDSCEYFEIGRSNSIAKLKNIAKRYFPLYK